MKQKVSAIIVLILILLGTIGYFLVRKSSQNTNQPLVDETANWKTYANSEYGFEFKYPENLVADEVNGSSNFENRFTSVSIDTSDTIKLNKSIEGSEPAPVLLGVGGYEPKNKPAINCADGVSFPVVVDGLAVNKCIRESMQGTSAMYIYISRDSVVYYSFRSDKYFGNDKVIVDQIISTFKFIEPITCKNEEGGVDVPVITSLSSYSGAVGTKLEINGCNFSGFEGDTDAQIENIQGVKGFLYGEAGSTSKLIKVALKSPLCEEDTSYSGLPCSAPFNLNPGTYKIYVVTPGKEGKGEKSNEVNFTIK